MYFLWHFPSSHLDRSLTGTFALRCPDFPLVCCQTSVHLFHLGELWTHKTNYGFGPLELLLVEKPDIQGTVKKIFVILLCMISLNLHAVVEHQHRESNSTSDVYRTGVHPAIVFIFALIFLDYFWGIAQE